MHINIKTERHKKVIKSQGTHSTFRLFIEICFEKESVSFMSCSIPCIISGCGAKTCILMRDDQANQGNVNDPNVDDWLLIGAGSYRNPILVNNNVPSSKYVMGSYFCGAGVGRDNRVQGEFYS